MFARPTSHPLSSDLPPLSVLGLCGRGRADWRRMRVLQYARLASIVRVQALIQTIAAVAVLVLLRPVVAGGLLSAWLLALAVSLRVNMWAGTAFAHVGRRMPARHRIIAHLMATVLNAIVWVVPILAMGDAGLSQVRIAIWTILALLMLASAVVIPAVPLATAIFALVLGTGSVVSFWGQHEYGMADVAALFTLISIVGAIQASRNYLITRIAAAGVAEHNELVSLLLREYEEGEANWLWETDGRQCVCEPSQRFVDALGLDAEEVAGHRLIALLAGGVSGQVPHASLRTLAEKLASRESFTSLAVRVSIRGEQRWWEVSGCPRFDGEGAFLGFRGVGADVTAEREHSERIAWLARYDTLTGLPNRMALTEALREAMGQARLRQGACAFLMIDLDRFKAVNDSLGHLIGDQLLARVSERLTGLVGNRDICARLGGDEFAIVIADAADSARVADIAEAAILRLSEPYDVEGHRLSVGASIGSAIAPVDGDGIDALMRHADLALYRAKDEGGGVHCRYSPGMSARAEERRRLETSLRGALARDEISLHFQPIVNSADLAVTGYEAMARWYSPEDGLIGPDRFIPIAEETRMSAPIGEWVLRAACAQAAKWPEDIALAVNVSAEQRLDSGFLDSVVRALASSALTPQRLSIEVTEAIFARDPVTARAVLEGVLALGCQVTLDDFGTGQSALCHLRALRFSTIKIDRGFVRGAAEGNRENLAIMRAAVAVASSLEMGVIVEGVENAAELALARQLDCSGVQGFLLGGPVTGEAVLETVRASGLRQIRAAG